MPKRKADIQTTDDDVQFICEIRRPRASEIINLGPKFTQNIDRISKMSTTESSHERLLCNAISDDNVEQFATLIGSKDIERCENIQRPLKSSPCNYTPFLQASYLCKDRVIAYMLTNLARVIH